MGRINTGGAKKRSGDNIATASSVSGTTLKLTPPKGYYDGASGLVTITDADFIAGNIKSGINLFGIAGTSVSKLNREKLTVTLTNISINSESSGSQEVTFASSSRQNIVGYSFGPTSGSFFLNTNGTIIDNTYNAFAEFKVSGSVALASYYSGLIGQSQPNKNITNYSLVKNGSSLQTLIYTDITSSLNTTTNTYTYNNFPSQNGITFSLRVSNSKAHPTFSCQAYISSVVDLYIYYYE